jgi:CRP/FNR family transcriptional regulator
MDNPERIIEILARCRLFARVDAQGRELLAAIAHREEAAKGRLLFRQGERCRAMYIIGAGQARVFQLAPSGKEHTLYLANAGDTFAEIAAIDGMPYPANAETNSRCEYLALDAAGLAGLIEREPRLCRQLMLGMAMWVRHTVGLLEDVVLRDAVGRLVNYLLGLPAENGVATMSASNVHVAKHLDLAPETLSRSLRRLQDDGAILVQGRQVELLQLEVLRALAAGI